MLPFPLLDSYRQYKHDTDKIASWLAATAEKCGFPSDILQKTSRPAQKAPTQKKASKSTHVDEKENNGGRESLPKYIIGVKDFVSLAEFIAGQQSNPAATVPASFLSVVDRVMTVRRRHATWYKARGSDPGRSSNIGGTQDGHEYFIGVLEHVKNVLRPRCAASSSEFENSTPVSNENDGSGSEKLHNLFANLAVDEPSEQFLSDPAAPANRPEKPVQYVAESKKDLEEAALAGHFLFNDLNTIREYLHEIWYDFGDGKADLITCAITTNSALDLAGRACEDFASQFPDMKYEKLMMTFYSIQCLHRGEDPRGGMNFAMHHVAEAFLLPTQILLDSLRRAVSPGQVPVYKPGHFGTYDPDSDWATKPPEKRFNDDKLILVELLPDFAFLVQTSRAGPAEDEVTRGFRRMVNKGEITLGFVFATRVFLDLHHIFGSTIGNGVYYMQQEARKICGSVKAHFEFHKDLEVSTWPKQNNQVLHDLAQEVERWALTDIIGNGLARYQKEKGIPPPEPYHLLKEHPIFCGLIAFHFRMRAQKVGITLANAYGSIIYSAHLYNAARQEGFLTRSWLDMEQAIELQGEAQVFIGDRPVDFDNYFKRFALTMGYSAQNFASNRREDRTHHVKASKTGPRGLKEMITPISDMFFARYVQGEGTIELTPQIIHKILEKTPKTFLGYLELEVPGENGPEPMDFEAIRPDGLNPNLTPQLQNRRRQRSRNQRSHTASNLQLSPVSVLDCLFLALSAEETGLKFDMLQLHRTCWRLLRSVQTDCHDQLLRIYEPGYLEEENQLPFVVGYIFMAAMQSSKIADTIPELRRKKDKGLVTSKLLATAAETTNGMIENGMGGFTTWFMREELSVYQ